MPIFTDVVSRHMQAGHLPGAVLAVASKDKTLCLETHGVSNLQSGSPMSPDTVFWIASMTKPFTATCAMLLVDDGKLDVDAPVEEYLPQFKNLWVVLGGDDDCQLRKRPKNKMLVRHLLAHTTGFPNISPIEPQKQDVMPLHIGAHVYAGTSLYAEPGAKYVYSNCGLNTVGRVIEVASGMPYDQFLKSRLLEPLGMSDTSFLLNKDQLSRLVTVYRADDATKKLVPELNYYHTHPLDNPARQPFPGGGLYSTIKDLIPWTQLLLNRGVHKGTRIFTEKTFDRFLAMQPDPGHDIGYGLGFAVHRQKDHGLPYQDAFGHGGAYQTNFTIFPSHGIATIYLVQLWGALGEAASANQAFRLAALNHFPKQ